MEIPQLYAIAAGGIFAIIITLRFVLYVGRVITAYASVFLLQHVQYPYFLNRHQFLGPWTRYSVALQVIYWIATFFCAFFRASNLADAGMRAGTLSLINMIPLYSGLHLSFIADLLGLSVRTYASLHGSLGVMVGALALLHIILALTQHGSGSGAPLYALVACTLPPHLIRARFDHSTGRVLHSRPPSPMPSVLPSAIVRDLSSLPPSPRRPDHVLSVAPHVFSGLGTSYISLHYCWKSHHYLPHTRLLDPLSEPFVPSAWGLRESHQGERLADHRSSDSKTVESQSRRVRQHLDALLQCEVSVPEPPVHDRVLDGRRISLFVLSGSAPRWPDAEALRPSTRGGFFRSCRECAFPGVLPPRLAERTPRLWRSSRRLRKRSYGSHRHRHCRSAPVPEGVDLGFQPLRDPNAANPSSVATRCPW